MRKRIPRRILTAALSLAMLLTLLPATALADGDTGETTTSGIELSKTATLEDDGTYTIDLEAYATGTTTTTTTTSSVPLDIVLVIDQSGSMAYNDNGSNTNTESDRRYYKLKAAVTSFVETIAENAETTGADHRIAITGYGKNGTTTSTSVTGAYISSGSNQTYWVNTGLFINGTLKNYGSNSQNSSEQLTTTDYQDALVSAYDTTTGSVTSSITTAISNFAAYGGTYTEYGLLMAQKVFANNSATYTYTDDNGETQTGTRKRIVILFTDGETDSDVSTVLSYSNTLKSTYDATVYCVGFGSSVNSDFLSYVSSNYGSDTSYTSGRGQTGTYSGTSNGTTKYSMTASNATELNNIFQTITEDVSSDSTTVTLDENAVMKDIMADGFTLTNDSTVTVTTYSGTADTDGNITFDTTATSTSESCTVTKDVENNTVSVTGFDYAENYISSGHVGEKICVTITGVLPTEDVTTNEAVSTNSSLSGIYENKDAETAAAYFEQPQTIITKKLYVLDYAKTADLTGLNQSSITNIVKSYQKVSASDSTTLPLTYGTSALAASTLSYTPTTMQWSGYDSFYVFGQTTDEEVMAYGTNTAARVAEDDTTTANLWSKVSVIPANNVYYEDDFVTTSTDGTTSTGTVGIVYSSGNWTEVGTTSGNTETANGGTYGYGWETQLADDTGDSDGSSHVSSTFGATATFTFTGTGVDIYGRTNINSGKIYVRLVNNDNTTVAAQSLLVDELSVYSDGDTNYTYYQIPTASFSNLDYGNYTVTITVMLGDDADGNYTYYLDGIRVYNPLGTVTEDNGDAYEAYEADNELNAVFTEVRNILIDAKSFTANYDGAGGVVFIDDNVYADTTKESETGEETESTEEATEDATDTTQTETANNTSVIGTYEDLGPKNEVYLAAGQSIAFQVSGGDHYYLGIKAPNGSTTATVTNGTGTSDLTINHSTDLYYEITPTSNGYIMVKNSGTSLLSITKLRSTSSTSAESGIALLSAEEVDEILVYAASFDSLETVAYTGTGADEDSAVDTDTGDTYEDLEEDDVVIDNPTEDTKEEPEEIEVPNSLQSIFSSLFSTIRNWFSGRR